MGQWSCERLLDARRMAEMRSFVDGADHGPPCVDLGAGR
jgi:hypothetical protein